MAAWAVPCALPGADAEGGGGTGTSFTSKAGDFSVRYPAGWDVIDGPNDTILLLLMQQPKAGGVPTRSMAVVIHPAEDGKAPAVRDVEQELLGFFKAIAPDATASDPQPAKLGGEPAERITFRGHDKQNTGADTRSVAIVCLHGKAGYALTCEGPVEGFEAELSDFEKVAQSFQFGAGTGDVFDDAAHHIRVHCPAGWRRTDVPGQAAVLALLPPTAAAPGKQEAVVMVDVAEIQPGLEKGGAAAYLQRVQAAAVQLDPTVRVTESADATLGRRPAKRLVLTGKRSGVAYTRAMTVCVQGRTAYSVFCGCDPDDYEKLRPAVQAMADSFEWTDSDAPAAAPKEQKKDDLPF